MFEERRPDTFFVSLRMTEQLTKTQRNDGAS